MGNGLLSSNKWPRLPAVCKLSRRTSAHGGKITPRSARRSPVKIMQGRQDLPPSLPACMAAQIVVHTLRLDMYAYIGRQYAFVGLNLKGLRIYRRAPRISQHAHKMKYNYNIGRRGPAGVQQGGKWPRNAPYVSPHTPGHQCASTYTGTEHRLLGLRARVSALQDLDLPKMKSCIPHKGPERRAGRHS